MDPRTVATLTFAVRHSKHSVRSHPFYSKYVTKLIKLININGMHLSTRTTVKGGLPISFMPHLLRLCLGSFDSSVC
jgi:hypothetical protein